MKDIAIFGVGGFGREVLSLIQDINKQERKWSIVGFFDDGYPIGTKVNGFENLGGIETINNYNKPLDLVIAIGTPSIKKTVISKISNPQINYPTIIHPTVIIGDKNYVRIGIGCIFCAYTIVTTNIEIGDFVILNLACTVGHDTKIGKYSAFMPTCNVSGEVIIEDGVYCGTGVKIINQTSIGTNTIVGAGAVVTNPLPSDCTAVGVPARVIKMMK